MMPGQKRTALALESGTSTFSRVVVGACQRRGSAPPSSAAVVETPRVMRERSRTESSPSLLADATMVFPERVVTSEGGLSTSQSWLSRFTSWLYPSMRPLAASSAITEFV